MYIGEQTLSRVVTSSGKHKPFGYGRLKMSGKLHKSDLARYRERVLCNGIVRGERYRCKAQWRCYYHSILLIENRRREEGKVNYKHRFCVEEVVGANGTGKV